MISLAKVLAGQGGGERAVRRRAAAGPHGRADHRELDGAGGQVARRDLVEPAPTRPPRRGRLARRSQRPSDRTPARRPSCSASAIRAAGPGMSSPGTAVTGIPGSLRRCIQAARAGPWAADSGGGIELVDGGSEYLASRLESDAPDGGEPVGRQARIPRPRRGATRPSSPRRCSFVLLVSHALRLTARTKPAGPPPGPGIIFDYVKDFCAGSGGCRKYHRPVPPWPDGSRRCASSAASIPGCSACSGQGSWTPRIPSPRHG